VITEGFLAVEEGHYLGHIGHTEESASHRLGRKRDSWLIRKLRARPGGHRGVLTVPDPVQAQAFRSMQPIYGTPLGCTSEQTRLSVTISACSK